MKKIIALSAVAALATTSFASTDVESRLSAMEAKVKKLEKKLKKANKKLNDVKAHDANDNIKWNIDFRTAMDSIHYKHADGSESSNPDLLTNRLWLGMAYAPEDNVFFKGKLSYNKVYGDTMNHSQSNTNPGYANFDWVTNENATDNTLKVKEAYWLYMNDTFIGTEVPWTISFGRRPSTDGLGINMREGMKDNSPLSHTVNVEFDGASAKFNLDKVTGIEGMWWKLCTGRGLTNAESRFQFDGSSYAAADSTTASHTKDVNMFGFIFVPWDNGQYSVRTNWARAENLIGFASNGTTYMSTTGAYDVDMSTKFPAFKTFGDMDLFTAMFKADGIGEEISDFLDNTKFFASFAQSKTRPKSFGAGEVARMLGSPNSETGHSWWVGANMPCPLTDDGRIGIEWNKGSRYWRSVTYGEDTMAGSKIAARGTAVEAYYIKPLTKSLTLNARYTKIDYDYTGSQAFFGDDGTPMDIDSAQAQGMKAVEQATDLRVSVSYKF